MFKSYSLRQAGDNSIPLFRKAKINDDTIYRDANYQDEEASINLKSYRLGLAQHCNSYFAIQKNGPIYANKEAFADLYKRGRLELFEFLKTI